MRLPGTLSISQAQVLTRFCRNPVQNCDISLQAASTIASLVVTSKTLQLIRLDTCEIPVQHING